MKVLEKAYNESVGNHEGIPFDMDYNQFSSPLMQEAKSVYGQYLRRFIKRDLIGISSPDGSGNCFPQLKGYNYLNDSKFYKKTRTKNSEGRELII
jgi:hypothetical protein